MQPGFRVFAHLTACVLLFWILCLHPVPSHAEPAISPGEILVKFRSAATKPSSQDLRDIEQKYGITASKPMMPARLSKPAGSHPFANLYKLHLTGDPIEAARAYALHPAVLFAQPNHLFYPLSTPNDPQYALQFNLTNIQWQTLNDALPPAQKRVVVAILDSGVDINHEDLRDNIWVNETEANGRPGIDDDANGYVDDIHGWDFTDAPTMPGYGDFSGRDNDPADESSHGTNISGVIAAVANNHLGIAGIAPDARIMPIRASASLLAGGSFLQEDDLAAGVIYAVENGAQIINMSWGGPESAHIIRDALSFASQQGVVLVAAAGNSGEPGLSYPAANNNTIAVGATDRLNRLAGFSSTGVALDVVAPGVNVLTTQLNNTYTPRSGTSLAAPHVSGLAALILSRNPNLTPEQVRSLLTSTAQDLGPPGFDTFFGAGLINAGSLATRISTFPPVVTILTPENEGGAIGDVAILAAASGAGLLSYRISYGIGPQPESWTLLRSGSPNKDIQFAWSVSGFQDTVAVLRLEGVGSDGLILEDRVLVHIEPTKPTLSALAYGPVLDGPRLVYEFRWLTDQRTLGGVAFKPFGVAGIDTLFTGLVDTAHRLQLPDNLPAGPLAFQVLAKREDGATGFVSPAPFIYVPFRVPTRGYTDVGTLPDGFLADRPADFNRDALPEIVLMPYLTGQTFSPVQIFERNNSGNFTSVRTTAESFLPWAIGDVTNDGQQDLLGASLLQLMVFQRSTSDPFPSQRILNLNNTWGGEIADTDGDGINNIVARSGAERGIRILQRDGDAAIREKAFLFDPTPGSGDLGTRFVVADFDGDGSTEILAGDGDGDLWITEWRGTDYAQTWLQLGDGDTRWVGGGTDLDNDGRIEFAVARAMTDDNEEFNGYWDLEVYSATGPGTYAIEWSIRITGVAVTGNGIISGDADGDGRDDLIVCLRPDLYVFRSDAPNLYRPVWHTAVSLMHRPMLADLDRDGLPELLYNRDGAIHISERSEAAHTVVSPQITTARPLDESRVEIHWMQTPEATTYRVYRAAGDSPYQEIAVLSKTTQYTDTALQENQTYSYQIAAILPDGNALQSAPVALTPNKPPTVAKLTLQNNTRLITFFSEQMAEITSEPSGYLITGLGHPTSVILDRNKKRASLTFSGPIDPDTAKLFILLATDLQGTPISSNQHYTLLGQTINPEFLSRADANRNGIIDFPDFIAFARAFNSPEPDFDFNADGLVNFPDFITFAALFGRSLS
ncbi:MAG: S8 family serine peptidase [bacterium]|nr:S8 family serine peptidase [bacterium]